MGVDKGFDLYPPLEKKEDDMKRWASFLNAVQTRYEGQGDTTMQIDKEGNIYFSVGEYPILHRQCYQFRRFSSKYSGRFAGNVAEYIDDVGSIARKYFEFGSRVVRWDEGWWGEPYDDSRRYGAYGWEEVYAARKLP